LLAGARKKLMWSRARCSRALPAPDQLRARDLPLSKRLPGVSRHSLLSAHYSLLKQAGRDLNPQPLVLETSALPIELPTYDEPRVTEGT
jgi:hypothetical protein